MREERRGEERRGEERPLSVSDCLYLQQDKQMELPGLPGPPGHKQNIVWEQTISHNNGQHQSGGEGESSYLRSRIIIDTLHYELALKS